MIDNVSFYQAQYKSHIIKHFSTASLSMLSTVVFMFVEQFHKHRAYNQIITVMKLNFQLNLCLKWRFRI